MEKKSEKLDLKKLKVTKLINPNIIRGGYFGPQLSRNEHGEWVPISDNCGKTLPTHLTALSSLCGITREVDVPQTQPGSSFVCI